MKGPAIFLAQFAGTTPPFDKLETMAQWAASLGYVGVQVPTDTKLFDLEQAAKSQTYCDEIAGKLADADIVISGLSTHLQGQLVAVHPAYAPQFAAFAPPKLRDKHPGEDLHDGATFDPSHFLLQQLDYAAFIDLYHERIKAFHVKDAEFRPNGRSGVYGGYQGWIDRPGRFRSLGDGRIDFKRIFSKLAQYGYAGWAVLEWECPLKHPEDGAREGAPFIREHMIRTTTKVFDDFAASGADPEVHARILGLDQ
jgi:sugar phosphate isomerase/epimerase